MKRRFSRAARVVHSKTIYKGRVVTLKIERVVEPGGVRTRREIVVHPGAVVLLPRLPGAKILLVRQYRHPARQSLWELVAGTLEPGENPRHAASRELEEETGYRARRMKAILNFYPSPGILSERMYLFEARGLLRSKSNPDDDERIQVRQFTLAQLRSMLRRKRFKDAKTLIGLLWLLHQSKKSR